MGARGLSIALVAILAGGGGAYAAAQVTGAQIQDGGSEGRRGGPELADGDLTSIA